jgi:hypothetical protein
MPRRLCQVCALTLGVWAAARAQGPARTVHVSSPKARLVAGEQIQLAAIARDQNGAARPNDAFQWRSSNTNLATVDNNGVVAARGLGLVDIFAVTAGVQGQVRLQILPQRIDVIPAAAELFVGDRLQYTAVARDINGAAIPGVNFTWQLTGANGGFTQAATVSGSGVLAARAAARITIRAVVPYDGVVSQFVTSFVGLARLEIKPRNDFRLTRVASTADLRHSFLLRPIAGRSIATNDLGQIALVGSLDGLTTALLLWENGRFDVLATGGSPGPTSGGILTDFSAPALNNRGQVLTRASAQGAGGLLLASRGSASYLAVDGQAGAGIEGLGGFNITPYSLNENGDVVYWASYRQVNAAQNRIGLFRQAAGGTPQLIFTSGDRLPSLGAANLSIGEFGIDRAGAVYFLAVAGNNRAVFRQERFLEPTRLVGTGDRVGDATLRNLSRLAVGEDGDVAFFYNASDNSQGVARFAAGRLQFAPHRSSSGILTAHSRGGVVYHAESQLGWGLYRWTGEGAPAVVLLQGRLAPNNEPVLQFYSAAVNSRGEVVAQLRTPLSESLFARPGAASPVLFQAGTRIDASAGPQLGNGSLLRGPGSGSPYLLLGSPSSVFQLGSRGLEPRLVLGDRLPDGRAYNGVGNRLETPDGNLCFDPFDGSNRILLADRLESYAVGQFTTADGVFVGRGTVRAFNARGAALWQAGTDRNHTRVYLTEGERNTLLLLSGPDPQWQTASPAGGRVTGFNEMVLDDRGRVLAVLRPEGGPSGLFLWENGRWRTTALFNTTQVNSNLVTNAGNLLAVGDRFYAVLNLRQGSALAELRDAEWTWIAGLNNDAPSGNTINNIGAYDVNRRGDIVFAANGGQLLIFRSGGVSRLVHFNVDAPEGLDFFTVQQVELREDGRIYFAGLNLLDQYVLYLAEPMLSTWPSRSRQRP